MLSTAAVSRLRPSLQRALSQNGTRYMTVLSKQSGEEYKKMNYTERSKKTGRPVSPHVLIYAFPIAAISSITNRVTGVALSIGAAGLGAAELVGGSGTSLELMQTIGGMSPLIAMSAKFCVAFPCTYHYAGAIRHLIWDARPELLSTIKEVEQSSYVLFGSSLVLSTGLMFM